MPSPKAPRLCPEPGCDNQILPLGTRRRRCEDCATSRERARLRRKWARKLTRKAIREHGWLRHQVHRLGSWLLHF